MEELIQEIDELMNIDTTDINLLIDRLNRLERVKYKITDKLVFFEKNLLTSNLKMLDTMLDDSKKYGKVLSSSTLTKDVLNAQSIEDFGNYRSMQEMLRNIRGSITSTITMISLEKDLRKLGGHN